MHPEEGVIQFRRQHAAGPLPPAARGALAPLLPVRRRLTERRWLGRDPARYGGLGFGNVSARFVPAVETARDGFLISAVQTAGRPEVGEEDFAWVTRWDEELDTIWSLGPALPSSESPTHATIYACDPGIAAVLHVHAPDLWRLPESAGLPRTSPAAGYGTVALAREVRRLWRSGDLRGGCFAMGGHEDGLVAFAKTPEAALARLEALAERG